MRNLSAVDAVILAGGLGTRVRSVIPGRPKVLAEILGRPFLTYLFDQLATAGISEVLLCTGYLGELIERRFGNSYGRLCLRYSLEANRQGTAGALRLAVPLIKAETVLVLNGDSFCQADLGSFWAWHCARRSQGTLLLAEVADTRRYGHVIVGEDGAVVRFAEKESEGGPGLINAGIYLLTRSLLLSIPSTGLVSLEEEMFPAWTGRGLYGYQNKGPFLDIGTPDAFASAERFMRTYGPEAQY